MSALKLLAYRIIALWITIFSVSSVPAQKNDYVWLTGYASAARIDTSVTHYNAGNTRLDFNYTPVNVNYDSLSMDFDFTSTCYSDTDGNLLFYTNGIYIANALDEVIANSDSLNAGYLQYGWDTTIQHWGYRNPQGIIAFKMGNAEKYLFIHSYTDTSNAWGFAVKNILSTLLDMSENAGHGQVLYKNNSVISCPYLGQELTATRHGNGKDWWVLAQVRDSNCYYRILITDTGAKVMPDLACGGPPIPHTDVGAVCFSPDGNKFAHYTAETGLRIFDFDRCTGELNYLVYIPINFYGGGNGVAFSPNGRFVYVSATTKILQYDLQASDIALSGDTVARYDGYHLVGAPVIQSLFNTAQIGPDGRIYISCGNSIDVYHYIKDPDVRGDSCHVMQHGLALAALATSIPNLPNYRLGPLVGSACDTLAGLNEIARTAKEKVIKVFPNPATDYAIVDYGFTDWSKGGARLVISNELGQLIYEQVLPMYSGYQKLDVSKFAAGFYNVAIVRNNGVVAVGKLIRSAE